MSVRSPLLLIAAAQAMVDRMRGDRRIAPSHAVDNGMRLVHHVGYWSHYSIRVGGSSWPFDPRCSLEALFKQAHTQSLFVDRAEAGDLVVQLTPLGTPRRIGIILYVAERVALYRAPTAHCHVAWANHGEPMTAIEQHLWLRASGSARFIAWHNIPVPQPWLRRAA
jgi:hypothetical protein